jgi:hypothetical protein
MMKKVSLVLLIAVIGCLGIATQMNATDAIYLKNEYGAPLTCNFMGPENNKLAIKDQKTVENGQSLFLMNTSGLKGVSDIWVTTGGMFSSVGRLELLSTLAPILNQSQSNKQTYAVITIKPTRWTWQIDVNYTNSKPE